MKKIIISIALFVSAFAISLNAFASDFNFYGKIIFNTTSEDLSGEITDTGKSDRDLGWGLSSSSRLGAKIKLSDQITGLFELGAGETLKVRHFYGVYDFKPGKILIGQTDNPISEFAAYSSQVGFDGDGLGAHGGLDGGRSEMIKFIFNNFQLAFIEPVTVATDINPEDTELFDVKIPQISAAYSLQYQNISFDAVGNYQKYEEESAATGQNYDIDSYAAKFGIKGEFGRFMLGATYGWGQNVGNMGIAAAIYPVDGELETPTAFFSNGYIHDIDSRAYTIVAGCKISDSITIEAGYGNNRHEIDNTEFDSWSYYLQSKIKIAEGFTITPEIGRADYGKVSGEDIGDIDYIAVKWQFDF